MKVCLHKFDFNTYCGCHICSKCELHAHVSDKTGNIIQTLSKCYCGWDANKYADTFTNWLEEQLEGDN